MLKNARAFLLAAAMALTVVAPTAHATGPDDPTGGGPSVIAYHAMVGPKWPTSGSPGTGHKLDCSTANTYYQNGSCNLDLSTGTAGCYYEVFSSSAGIAPEPRFPSPMPCEVDIHGPVKFTRGAWCHLTATALDLQVHYALQIEPGVIRNIYFQTGATFTVLDFADAAETAVRAVKIDFHGGGTTNYVGEGTIAESVIARFASPLRKECPNPDNDTNSIAAIRDTWVDQIGGSNPGASGNVQVTFGETLFG